MGAKNGAFLICLLWGWGKTVQVRCLESRPARSKCLVNAKNFHSLKNSGLGKASNMALITQVRSWEEAQTEMVSLLRGCCPMSCERTIPLWPTPSSVACAVLHPALDFKVCHPFMCQHEGQPLSPCLFLPPPKMTVTLVYHSLWHHLWSKWKQSCKHYCFPKAALGMILGISKEQKGISRGKGVLLTCPEEALVLSGRRRKFKELISFYHYSWPPSFTLSQMCVKSWNLAYITVW